MLKFNYVVNILVKFIPPILTYDNLLNYNQINFVKYGIAKNILCET